MPPKLLSPRELAEQLDSSYYDVLAWARDGLIPSIQVSGRYYFNLNRVVKALRQAQAQAERREASPCA